MSLFAKLVTPVGSAMLSSESLPPPPLLSQAARAAHIVAASVAARAPRLVGELFILLLQDLSGAASPRCEQTLSGPEKGGEHHADQGQYDDRNEHPRRLERVGVRHNKVAEAGDRGEELRHDHTDEPSADCQLDTGEHIRERCWDEQVAPDPLFWRTERTRDLEKLGVDLLHTPSRVDHDREEHEECDNEDLGTVAEAEPQHNHWDECDRR